VCISHEFTTLRNCWTFGKAFNKCSWYRNWWRETSVPLCLRTGQERTFWALAICLAYISAAESIRISSTTFTQSAQKATEFGEIMQPLNLLRCSRSFKVTEFGTNRKLICNFLLVINSNLPPIFHRFRDIALERSKIATFFYPSLV